MPLCLYTRFMLRVGQPEWDDIKIWGSSSGTLDINVASHVGHQFITSSKTKVSRKDVFVHSYEFDGISIVFM